MKTPLAHPQTSKKSQITLGLIEDDSLLRDTLQNYLTTQAEFTVTLSVASVNQLTQQLLYLKTPDIILVDIALSGVDAIRLIKQDNPNTEVMVLSMHCDSDKIFAALSAGASGYLLKNTELAGIKQAIIELYDGGAPMSGAIARKVLDYFKPKKTKPALPKLTPREQQIVDALMDGLSYKQIAARLSIGLETVRHHIKNVYHKFQVNSKSQVVAKVLHCSS